MSVTSLPPLMEKKKSSDSTSSNLRSLICDNFVTYHKSHTFHLNVRGPNFSQYHALLQEVYDKLWEWHDTLAEQLRQGGELYTFSLGDLSKRSAIKDDAHTFQTFSEPKLMFKSLESDLEQLLAVAEKIYLTADPALETVIGDYCADVKKLEWKICATNGGL